MQSLGPSNPVKLYNTCQNETWILNGDYDDDDEYTVSHFVQLYVRILYYGNVLADCYTNCLITFGFAFFTKV